MSGRRLLLSTMKGEAPYIVEWVAHYRSIGINDIRVASNDSSDGTKELLDCLDDSGVVRHLENSAFSPKEAADPQKRAYDRLWADSDVRNAEWILVADADEFLNIHTGDGTLEALVSASESSGGTANAISVPWRVFGNSYIERFRDLPVTRQFTLAAEPGVHPVQRYTAFKTLFRPGGVRRLGIHRPRFRRRYVGRFEPFRWLNASGMDVTDALGERGWRMSGATYGCSLAQMNHYMIRSSEAFLMKRWRGTANSGDPHRIDLEYFETFNANSRQDLSIGRHRARLEAETSALFGRVPGLKECHASSVAFHSGKIAKLKTEMLLACPHDAGHLGLNGKGE